MSTNMINGLTIKKTGVINIRFGVKMNKLFSVIRG